MNEHYKLAIVICTFNRCQLLRAAIESLIGQEGSNFANVQLIIIDSSSSDGTAGMVKELQELHPNIHLEITAKLGLPRARNDALEVCNANYIGYFDDDAKAPPHWIGLALEIIDKKAPVVFGGPFYPFYLSFKPRWFRDEWGSVEYGSEPRFLSDSEFLNGGNIFFNVAALREVGGFQSDFVKGEDSFAYGEEAAPQIALRADRSDNVQFYMDPALYILHLVRPERLDLIALAREHFEYGRGYGKLYKELDENNSSLVRLHLRKWKSIFYAVLKLPMGVFRDQQVYPLIQHFWVEEVFRDKLKLAGIFAAQIEKVKYHRK